MLNNSYSPPSGNYSQGHERRDSERGQEQPPYSKKVLNSQFYIARILLVIFIMITAATIPSINILLTLAGSIIGTVVSIVIPVMFYNRAY